MIPFQSTVGSPDCEEKRLWMWIAVPAQSPWRKMVEFLRQNQAQRKKTQYLQNFDKRDAGIQQDCLKHFHQ